MQNKPAMLKLGLDKHIAVHGVLRHCSSRSVDDHGKLTVIIISHRVLREVLTPRICRVNTEEEHHEQPCESLGSTSTLVFMVFFGTVHRGQLMIMEN